MTVSEQLIQHLDAQGDDSCNGLEIISRVEAMDARIMELEHALKCLLSLDDLERGDMSLFFTQQPRHPITHAHSVLHDEQWKDLG